MIGNHRIIMTQLRRTTDDSEECSLDMSPMIDMVFLLLIFFIVNATAIVVRTDPDVALCHASAGAKPPDGRGRIVVNVRADGTFTAEDPNVRLADGAAVEEMVRRAKVRWDAEGVGPSLHLRGDRAALFRHSRVAVKAAAKANVHKVVFSVLPGGC